MTTAVAVLAAGAGARFTGPTHKLLAPVNGRPLLSWAVDAALGAGGDEVLVITGAVDLAGLLPAGVRVVRNERWKEGQATSVALAVDEAGRVGHDAVVIGLGDQPGVPSAAWAAVVASAGAIAVATYGARRGNPVRLAEEVWPLVARTGDEGARALMRRRPDLVVEVACEGDPADVDTVEDLDRWS